MFFVYLSDCPLPKRYWFGVWIVDTKNLHSLFDPKYNHRFQLFPQRLPIVSFEIERVNVLIFFRWIFSVLNGTIRSLFEPFRVFFHIGMIWRTLKSEIKCDIDPVLQCFLDEFF